MMNSEILFLAHRIPFPPNRGDKIRAHHILRALADITTVHVACFSDDSDDEAEVGELAMLAHSYRLVRRRKPLVCAGLEAMVHQTPVSLTAFYDHRLASFVQDLLASGRIATIYVFSGQMGQYVPSDWNGRIIMDFVDVDSAKFEAYASRGKAPMRWLNAREARLLRAEEARLARLADVSLLVSDDEARLFRSRLTGDTLGCDVRMLGNGIDSDVFNPAHVDCESALAGMPGPHLLFSGQMDYPPNIAAVQRAALHILPLIRQSLPQARLHIVGRNPTAAVSALSTHDGVHVWGRVDDMRPWLRAADMALVPLDIARGVQNKVLEAMAMGKPVVLTHGAAEGIEAINGKHYSMAQSDAELAAAVIALVQDSKRARAMGQAARDFVMKHRSWASVLTPLAELLRPPIMTLRKEPTTAQGGRHAA